MKDAIKVYGFGILVFVGVGLVWGWVQPKPVLPENAPAFVLPDIDGREHRLEDYLGRTVVLNFWATWCGPCRREIPEFSAFSRENPDVTVLGIATDQSVGKLRAAREQMGISYPVLVIDAETKSAYDISTLPTTVVVDPQGRVQHVKVGAMSRRQLDRAVFKP